MNRIQYENSDPIVICNGLHDIVIVLCAKVCSLLLCTGEIWDTLPHVLAVVVMHILCLIYLFGILRPFQHCTGHITTGSWKGRGNQYIQFVRALYCKLPTNSKQLPAFPLEAMPGTKPRSQRWEARVLPLCHRGPYI